MANHLMIAQLPALLSSETLAKGVLGQNTQDTHHLCESGWTAYSQALIVPPCSSFGWERHGRQRDATCF